MSGRVQYDCYPISMDKVIVGIQRLRNLPQHMPSQPASLYDFGRKLADSLEDRLTRVGSSRFEVFDFDMAIFFVNGAKPPIDVIVSIAKSAFGDGYADALRNYYLWHEYVKIPIIHNNGNEK